MAKPLDPNTYKEDADLVADDAGEKTLPLLGGVVRPEDLPQADGLDGEIPRGNRGIHQGTLLLLLVVALAVGAILLMRTTQDRIAVRTSDSKSLEAKIEQALVKLTNPQAMDAHDVLQQGNMQLLFRDTNAVIGMFTDDRSRCQVPVDELKKNPFLAPLYQPLLEAATGRPANEQDAQAQAGKLKQELSQLKLETVVQGRVPMAIINGNLVSPGQKIGSFTVKTINGLTVELEAAGQKFYLTMDDQDSNKNRPRLK